MIIIFLDFKKPVFYIVLMKNLYATNILWIKSRVIIDIAFNDDPELREQSEKANLQFH